MSFKFSKLRQAIRRTSNATLQERRGLIENLLQEQRQVLQREKKVERFLCSVLLAMDNERYYRLDPAKRPLTRSLRQTGLEAYRLSSLMDKKVFPRGIGWFLLYQGSQVETAKIVLTLKMSKKNLRRKLGNRASTNGSSEVTTGSVDAMVDLLRMGARFKYLQLKKRRRSRVIRSMHHLHLARNA